MNERRLFPRLQAPVLCRSAGLGGPRRPALDASEGGLLMYSDEAVAIGTRLELEILGADQRSVELYARVVRVDRLPAPSPARFDVALEFLDLPAAARAQLVLLGVIEAAGSQSRVEEHQPEQVRDVEQQHRRDGLLKPAPGASIARGPHGDGHVREENRDQKSFLHSVPNKRARTGPSSRKRSVLFVTPYLPSPPRFGGQARMHGLISGLARTHDVSVLSLVDPREDQSEGVRATREYCGEVAFVDNLHNPGDGLKKRWRQLSSVLSSRSYESTIHREPALEAALDRQLAAHRYDVVHFEFPSMTSFALDRAPRVGPATLFVLDEHNIEWDIARQTSANGLNPLRRGFGALDGRKIHAEEIAAWTRLDGCTVTSVHDREMLLAEAPAARTAVVPNGVDLDFFRPGDAVPNREAPMILFFGAIDYHPNTEGLLWFFREIWPLLDTHVPGIRVCVAGRRPPPSILALQGPNVEITGVVPDLRPYLERAAVVIAPLRIGGGTRLKILEAMAMGKPIVSTSLGAQGLAVQHGRELLLADDRATFAAQVRRLLDDTELAGRVGAAALRFVTEHHSWQASVGRLSAFYDELSQQHAEAEVTAGSA
jgi:glycosyltransferase involved in cell wall biosynthesis